MYFKLSLRYFKICLTYFKIGLTCFFSYFREERMWRKQKYYYHAVLMQ